jgi:hypothetical protein
MSNSYYGKDEENVKKGIARVRKSIRLHDFDDERQDENEDSDGGMP